MKARLIMLYDLPLKSAFKILFVSCQSWLSIRSYPESKTIRMLGATDVSRDQRVNRYTKTKICFPMNGPTKICWLSEINNGRHSSPIFPSFIGDKFGFSVQSVFMLNVVSSSQNRGFNMAALSMGWTLNQKEKKRKG